MCSEIIKFIRKQTHIFSADIIQSILKENSVPARIIDEVMKSDQSTSSTTASTTTSSFQSFRKNQERMRQLREGASTSEPSNPNAILIFWLGLFEETHFSFFVTL